MPRRIDFRDPPQNSSLVHPMQRAIRRMVSFTTHQVMATMRRPSRLVLGPYRAGLSIERWKRIFAIVSELPEQVPVAARRILVPKAVETDVGRVFALVTKRLVRVSYPPGYQISRIWRDHLRSALAMAGKNPSAGVLAYVSLSVFDLELKKLSDSDRQLISQRRRDYNRKHNELSSLCESPVFPENTRVTVDESTYSNKMDQAFSYYDDIYSGIPKTERLRTIVEIGGGYGRFARIMHQLDPSRCYVLIDLPESLIFSYAFLAVNFPGAKMLVISSAADARIECAGEFDFVFCPVQFIGHLSCGEVDLVINTYSFAEMPQISVDYLIGCIHDVLRPRYLYSLNMMFSDKDINFDTGGLDGEANEVALNLRPEWRIRSFSLTAAIFYGKYRLTAGAVLEHVLGDSKEAAVSAALIEVDRLPCGHPARVANLYFAALWSLDAQFVQRFRSELEQYCIACQFSPDVGYDFERIGEVRYLKRVVSEANVSNETGTAQSSALRG